MQKIDYAKGLTVIFTDDEYARLQKIKEDPGWKPREQRETSRSGDRVSIHVSYDVREKAKKYAKTHNISMFNLWNNLMEVLTA